MAINFSNDVYRICQDFLAVPVVVHPFISQPDAASYENRGIFNKYDIDVVAEDGSIFSDQRVILDIRTAEYPILPRQKDRVTIPFDSNGEPLGEFEITDSKFNGGGEMTLTLQRIVDPGDNDNGS